MRRFDRQFRRARRHAPEPTAVRLPRAPRVLAVASEDAATTLARTIDWVDVTGAWLTLVATYGSLPHYYGPMVVSAGVHPVLVGRDKAESALREARDGAPVGMCLRTEAVNALTDAPLRSLVAAGSFDLIVVGRVARSVMRVLRSSAVDVIDAYAHDASARWPRA